MGAPPSMSPEGSSDASSKGDEEGDTLESKGYLTRRWGRVTKLSEDTKRGVVFSKRQEVTDPVRKTVPIIIGLELF